METERSMREAVQRLQLLATMTIDPDALHSIQTVILALEHRIHHDRAGHAPRLWPPASQDLSLL